MWRHFAVLIMGLTVMALCCSEICCSRDGFNMYKGSYQTVKFRGADKSFARPGRKQVTATKL